MSRRVSPFDCADEFTAPRAWKRDKNRLAANLSEKWRARQDKTANIYAIELVL
jgi:hypothetical protein